MTLTPRIVSPALPDDLYARARALARGAPLRCYVEAPLADGLGAGLTRRHDAVLRHVQALAASGTFPDLGELGARTNLFRRILAERGRLQVDDAAPLLGFEGFVAAAQAISGQPDVTPTMLYVNALLPGQELMWHTDTPEFVGLDKQDVPEWLLVVMLHSGLFDAERMPVAGGVTFFGAVDAGAFGWRLDGEVHTLDPAPNTAILLDADHVPHGVLRVGGPDASAPPVSADSELVPVPGGWSLRAGGREVAAYGEDEVRLSMQWKARCTGDLPDVAPLTEELAVARLRDALAARGVALPDDGPDLAIGLMDAFVPQTAG